MWHGWIFENHTLKALNVSSLPEKKIANMRPGRGNSGGSWPSAFPRSLKWPHPDSETKPVCCAWIETRGRGAILPSGKKVFLRGWNAKEARYRDEGGERGGIHKTVYFRIHEYKFCDGKNFNKIKFVLSVLCTIWYPLIVIPCRGNFTLGIKQ